MGLGVRLSLAINGVSHFALSTKPGKIWHFQGCRPGSASSKIPVGQSRIGMFKPLLPPTCPQEAARLSHSHSAQLWLLPPLCCLLPAWTPTVRPGTCLIELAVNEASFHIPCFYFAALFSRFGETSLHQTSCRDGESVFFFFCHLSMTMNEGCVSFLLPLLTPLGSFLCCFIFLPFFGSGGCSTGRGIDPSAPASAPASPLRLHRPRGSDKPHPQG